MKAIGFIAAIFCLVCLIRPFKGREISPGMTQDGQRLSPEEAIDAARHNSRAGSSFTVLREIVANADTRRIGDQALKEAQTAHINLYKNGILADVLRDGGFLLAETDPRTNNVLALHLISLGPTGVPNGTPYWSDGVVKLADAQELAKDTADFVEKLYSTPSSEGMSLESRFYGGGFPKYSQSEDYSLFAIPDSLLKVGVGQNECREAVALYGGYVFWAARYAVSTPAFAANPAAAENAAEEKRRILKEEFLRKNHMDPDFRFDPESIRSKDQFREWIDLLRKLDAFMEQTLNNETNPALVKANISVAAIPLGVSADANGRQVLYGSGMGSLFVIYWQRLAKGGFAVYGISEAG